MDRAAAHCALITAVNFTLWSHKDPDAWRDGMSFFTPTTGTDVPSRRAASQSGAPHNRVTGGFRSDKFRTAV